MVLVILQPNSRAKVCRSMSLGRGGKRLLLHSHQPARLFKRQLGLLASQSETHDLICPFCPRACIYWQYWDQRPSQWEEASAEDEVNPGGLFIISSSYFDMMKVTVDADAHAHAKSKAKNSLSSAVIICGTRFCRKLITGAIKIT
jgi:hypothetical protein